MEDLERLLATAANEVKRMIEGDSFLRHSCPEVVLAIMSEEPRDLLKGDRRTRLVASSVDSLQPQIEEFVSRFSRVPHAQQVLMDYFSRPAERNYFGSMVVLGEGLAVWARLYCGILDTGVFTDIRFACLVGGAYYKIIDALTDSRSVEVEQREDLYVSELLFLEFLRRMMRIAPSALETVESHSAEYVDINVCEKRSRRQGAAFTVDDLSHLGKKLAPLHAVISGILNYSGMSDSFVQYSRVMELAGSATQIVDDLHDVIEDIVVNQTVSPSGALVMARVGIAGNPTLDEEFKEKLYLEAMLGESVLDLLDQAADSLSRALRLLPTDDYVMRLILLLRLYSLGQHKKRRQRWIKSAYDALAQEGIL